MRSIPMSHSRLPMNPLATPPLWVRLAAVVAGLGGALVAYRLLRENASGLPGSVLIGAAFGLGFIAVMQGWRWIAGRGGD